MNLSNMVREFHPKSVAETLKGGDKYRFRSTLRRAVVADAVASNRGKKASDICMEVVEKQNIGYGDYEHAKAASPSKSERTQVFFSEAALVLEKSSDPDISQAAKDYREALETLKAAEEKFKPIMNSIVHETEDEVLETRELLEKTGHVRVSSESFVDKLI